MAGDITFIILGRDLLDGYSFCPMYNNEIPVVDMKFGKQSTQRVGILNYNPPASRNIINLRLDITHLYYPAKNSFQKGRLKRREIFTELLLYTLTT